MHDDILKKLEGRLDRRSFLRGSGLVAAAALGVAAFSGSAFAQDAGPAQNKDTGDSKKDDKPADPAKKDDTSKAEPKPESKDDKKEEDPFKVTKKDERGRDYRVCPQCGYNMYKQDRTWTCENCGYSYAE